MIIAFCICMIGYVAVLSIKLLRRPAPTTLGEFFSFGSGADKASLRDAFFVTNASFATAFVTLFLYVGSQGLLSIVTPIAFFVGTLAFTYWFLPSAFAQMASGKRYPELLGTLTKSRPVRVASSIYIIISLWLFTYVEIQGFLSFARSRSAEFLSPTTPFFLAVPIVLFMGLYTAKSGFSAVVASDRLQRILIAVGAVAFAGLAGFSLLTAGPDATSNTVSGLWAQLQPVGALTAIVETLIGFLFSQLLYYDNWQRISAYAKVRRGEGVTDPQILMEVTSAYRSGSVWLLILYLVPIAMGLSALAMGNAPQDVTSLVSYLEYFWGYSIWSAGLLILCFLYLAAALISTIEVYVISIVNNIVDDITGLMKVSTEIENGSAALLPLTRVLSFFVAVSFLPALFVQPDFEKIFVFLFYSANGFVGPVMMLVWGRDLKAWAVFASLACCALLPGWALLSPASSGIVVFPGLLTVVVSLVICFLGSSKRSRAT